MDIGKIYFAQVSLVDLTIKYGNDLISSHISTTQNFCKFSLVYRKSNKKFIDLKNGNRYKLSTSSNLKIGDKTVDLKKAIPFGKVVTDASDKDSKDEIIKKANMVKIIPEENGYRFLYIPTEDAYISIVGSEFEKIFELINLIYHNNLVIDNYQIRQYLKEENKEPEVYVYMKVNGPNALRILENISDSFNISSIKPKLEDLEEYKQDTCLSKQKRITR